MQKGHNRTFDGITRGLKLLLTVLVFSLGNFALVTLWEPIIAGIGAILEGDTENFRWSTTLWLALIMAIVSYGGLVAIATYWLSDFTCKFKACNASEYTPTATAPSTKTPEEESGKDNSTTATTGGISLLSPPGMWGMGALLFLFGALLFIADSDARFAIGAISWGLSAIFVSYATWSLFYGKDGWKRPSEFAKQAGKALCTVFALLGLGVILQGIGSLVGWDGLRFIGRTLAEVFGGS